MTTKENVIIKTALDRLRRAWILKFHSRSEDVWWPHVDVARDLLETLFDEIEKKADVAETIIMKKTTQRSPEWRGRANC